MRRLMNRTRIVFAVSTCFWLALGPAEAEFIGLNISDSHLTPALSRTYITTESTSLDLVDDLDIENPQQSSMVFILEHPIPVLPNIRYQGFDLDANGEPTLDTDLRINGGILNRDSDISGFDLSHDDIVLYYQLSNNRVDLDLGVDLKRFDGELSLDRENGTVVTVDETIPLLYLSARFDLPYNGFYVGANINANIVDLGLSNSSAQDSTIMLGYESGNGLGIEGGFKYFSLELDNVDNLNTDIEYDGIYLNGYINF